MTNHPPAHGGEQTPPLESSELRVYAPDAVVPSKLKDHRYWIQTQMGVWVAATILLALLLTIGLVAYLAIANRSSSYISATAESLQPFILPTLGALVGYSLRAQQERAEE
jgi:hypothetical protein